MGGTGGAGVGAAAGGAVGEAAGAGEEAGAGEAAGVSRLGSWATPTAAASMNTERRTGDLKRSGALARAQES